VTPAMQTTVLCVKPGFGRWHVQEEGFAKSLAYFPSEQEAIDYAVAFGKTKPVSVIRVLDERGDIRLELNVEMEPPGEHAR
jgi:hypothetical protein